MLIIARTTGVQTVVTSGNSNPQVMWYSTIVPCWPVPPVLGPRQYLLTVTTEIFNHRYLLLEQTIARMSRLHHQQ